MQRISLVKSAHDLIRDRLYPGAVAIDATVGNGYDTLFLLQQVAPSGRVYGFDIQQTALASARAKIGDNVFLNCLTLFQASHELLPELIPARHHGRVRACMFNLGYLPRGDKSIVTRTASTLAALNAACRLLAESGVITIIAYPGHPGGGQETEQVTRWCESLDRRQFDVVTVYLKEQENDVPRLFVVYKLG
ncbi:MAG: class I SAM-dependent methyltransferase [Gammaproteobacteria bacterium]